MGISRSEFPDKVETADSLLLHEFKHTNQHPPGVSYGTVSIICVPSKATRRHNALKQRAHLYSSLRFLEVQPWPETQRRGLESEGAFGEVWIPPLRRLDSERAARAPLDPFRLAP